MSHVGPCSLWICGLKETDGELIPVSGQCSQTVSSSVPLTERDEVAFRTAGWGAHDGWDSTVYLAGAPALSPM